MSSEVPPQQVEHNECQDSESQPQQNPLDRFAEKYKLPMNASINQDVNVSDVALTKYNEMKKNYTFITFEEGEKKKKITNGEVEKCSLPIFDFNQNMYKYWREGTCDNPNVNVKGSIFRSQGENQESSLLQDKQPQGWQALSRKQRIKKLKEQRQRSSNSLNYLGPWAGYGENLQNGALTIEQREMLEKAEEKKQLRIEEAKKKEQNFEPYSIFHWPQREDYKGQSYLDGPADFKPQYGKCYIPEKNTHSWFTTQKAGFQVIRFFPKSGHFIMSGNAEGKVLLFDLIKDRSLVHTYVGHSKALRDIQFTNDGKHFLSCGFDGIVHYWDTEYGRVLRTFKLKKLPFTVKFHPQSERQHSFLCGSSNKKIMQFDIRTGTKEMEYNQHLGTVNTITFLDNLKFVSSSDDKKLFVWEFGIPVVTKHVSEPEMHTITATAMHPQGEFFAGQSSNNEIVIYENKGGNFRRIRNKSFTRHNTAGYACGIDFSHDGQFLMSGDERGKVFFYDWKTSKLLRTFDAHPSVCINAEWHPSDPTTVATCGWQGYLKIWEGK